MHSLTPPGEPASRAPTEPASSTGRLRSLSTALQAMATDLAQARRENARLRRENRSLRAHLGR